MKKFFQYAMMVFALLFIGIIALSIAGIFSFVNTSQPSLKEASILHLQLKGVITGEDEFLEHLVEYRDDDHIKGVLIEVDSPGGVVGPSQEIYAELKRVREELNKPVVVSCNALAASGAYYAAVAADRIFANPGTLMGSIGVIMQFTNLEKLYNWAKMDFFTITTGKYKDSGSPYRSMREDERQLFQGMIDEVLVQFKDAVKAGRKNLRSDDLDQYADGRVFNGIFAVKHGFADELGTFEDAKRYIGELTGLGKKPHLFKPKDTPENLIEWLNQNTKFESSAHQLIREILPVQLAGKPLFLMPGVLGR